VDTVLSGLQEWVEIDWWYRIVNAEVAELYSSIQQK